ncbi:MAG: hypothetical protein LBS50_04440 [Prevotellaceae bacterium]|jgi:hypothetical protein|nr:hypothetical protein [Prevotellaceae bacterium]
MKTEKFTEQDRKLVLEKLERIQKVKLISVKSSRKLYLDENDLPFLIFGGGGNWHGITEKGMSELGNYQKEGAFVVVKKYKTKMDINVGSLSVFFSNKNKLVRTKSNGFQFHCVATEDGLYLARNSRFSLQ